MSTEEEIAKFDKPTAYFEQHREEFVKEHHRKWMIMSLQDNSKTDFFADSNEAYLFGAEKYGEGEFMLRQVLRKDEEPEIIFHSRVA
ncbi:MAG: hypothetical protein M2R45_01783 [Verrucomicrobia subdivision 3 bacterium]|nr:hypothetical protein [Limisphaerales bacterium]MCS1415862.1 hypothetical protein [Limisphaerales bacterium]